MGASRKCISKQTNKAGTQFALVSNGAKFEVWKLCENYSRECKGGLKKAWRYVQQGMDEAAARDLFTRRVQGAQR